MSRRPVDAGIRSGREEPGEGPGVPPDEFREALARWATGVTVAAVRDDGRIHATTVSSFAPVSAEPPRIVVSLGAGAQILPFLDQGARFAVTILSEGQRRHASVFADSFPVGPSPFPEAGDPVVEGGHAHVVCRVDEVVPVGSNRLVIGLVVAAGTGPGERPLLYHRRDYRSLE